MLGYHFVGETLRDGRPVPSDGEWLEHVGPVVPCQAGLHMSEHPFDAIKYAPGGTLCLVELEGDLQPHGCPVDKWVGRRRKIIKRIDADLLLRRFAADQALAVSHLWDMPLVVREYLITLDKANQAAAMAAARAAARDEFARAAARDAAWAAARAAARDGFAWGAAMDAAWAAARAAAAAGFARAAARDAAWAAARAAARDEFARRVETAFQTQ